MKVTPFALAMACFITSPSGFRIRDLRRDIRFGRRDGRTDGWMDGRIENGRKEQKSGGMRGQKVKRDRLSQSVAKCN